LKVNFKIITEAKECVLMPNQTDSLEQIDKKLQPLVEDESENDCVQPSKKIEKCAYDNSE
jgi:hypothetical protein